MAAGISIVLAALLTTADTALTSLSHARLGALVKEAPERYHAALARLAAKRGAVQARYLVARVTALACAIAAYLTWLAGRGHDALWTMLWAGGGLILFAILIECAAVAGRRGADWVVPLAALGLRPVEWLVMPIALVTQLCGRVLVPFWRPADPKITEVEVELMVEQGEQSGVLQEGHAEMIRNVLEFDDLCAEDAMVPRSKVVAIRLDTPIQEVLRTITETGHSRYPVYREEADDVFGLLYAKDLFRVVGDSWRPPAQQQPIDESPSLRAARLLDIVRQPLRVVAQSQRLSSILKEMRQEREHLAIVVDEFGGFSGVITLEDILEEIVGDIRDESDAVEAPIVDHGDGRLEVDASVLVCELSAYLGFELDPEEQYDTLGGLLVDKLGQVPTTGTSTSVADVSFVVLESDEKHICRVEVVRTEKAAPPSEPPAEAPRAESDFARVLTSLKG